MPEIVTHKAQSNSGLSRLAEADADFDVPYWAFYWGGGLSLARHVLDHPDLVAGRRVLDLGTGSGLVAIAAAKAGARRVMAADIDPYAIIAATLNAEVNGVEIETCLGDLTAGQPPEVDILLVGDLFYDAEIARSVSVFLDRCLDADIAVLIGDPGRGPLPRARLDLLAEYPGLDFGDSGKGEPGRNAVFSYKRSS